MNGAAPVPTALNQRTRATRWIVAAALGLVLAAVGLGGAYALRIRQVALSARRAVAARNWELAEQRIDDWLWLRPGSAEAEALKAEVALNRDRPQAALKALNRAHRLGHPQAAVDRLRGLLLARLGRPVEAEPLLRRAWDTARRPDPDVDEALARIYLESFRLGAANVVVERWMRDAPDDPKPYLWRTQIRRRTEGDPFPMLVDDYREALRRDPNSAEARLGLAEALRETNRLSESAAAYAAYLERSPNDPAGHLGAARTALKQGEDASAVRQLDRALELDPRHHEALLERAGVHLRHGQPAVALALIDRALRVEPDDPEAHYRRGLVLSRLGRSTEARREHELADRLRAESTYLAKLRDGLVQNPNDPELQRQAARWLVAHGHPDEGLRWARQVLRELPSDPAMNRLLADYYEQQGNAGLANFYRAAGGGPR